MIFQIEVTVFIMYHAMHWKLSMILFLNEEKMSKI